MNEKYRIGEKIKNRRLALGKTQNEIAGEYMTRNMLSLIESSKAIPSVETLDYIAEALDIPLAYFLSTDDTLFINEKERRLPIIKRLFREENYDDCVSEILKLSGVDDELNYILAYCYFHQGRNYLFGGSLLSAEKKLSDALRLAEETPYVASQIVTLSKMYLAVAANIQSPLLELDTASYEADSAKMIDLDFYEYLTMNHKHQYSNDVYSKHLEAKQLIKKYAYGDAIPLLLSVEEMKNHSYNACVLFGVYSDLEFCYKQVGDFENAYRYSTKRISLISAFNT